MKYFDIYKYLLALMNNGEKYYSTVKISEKLEINKESVEKASHILEERE